MQVPVRLEDRYELGCRRVLLNGTQALVRLLLMQGARDHASGVRSAGYVSGYRGSPLGGLDQQLRAAQSYLDGSGVHFEPGVNEDLAATAIWGTQQVGLLPGARVDGVYALWYGKGPGVDRSGDPFKHGNRAGTAAHGGVLVVFGDDHAGKSSTVAYQSDPAIAAHGIPVLYPATVQEILDLGLHGWALSRYAGVWVGLKTVNETIEATATVDGAIERISIALPDDPQPPGGVNVRIGFDPLGDDVRLQRFKLPRVLSYARANRLDRVTHGADGPLAGLGLVTAGKTWLDVVAALRLLGLEDEASIIRSGVSVYKLAMISPLEPIGLREFARGRREILVIEEKAPFVELQAARLLFELAPSERPAFSGKVAADGTPLLPSDVPLDPLCIAITIGQRLLALGLGEASLAARVTALQAETAEVEARQAIGRARTPYFCSGCPHNTSTQVPEGSLAFGGIGCHTMALFMDRHTLPPTQMGGEGANWIGMAPFTEMPHAFQNLGDGTYFHSGLLAIRAAVTSGVNLTYKLLYNDAVAMTGGQSVEGGLSVAEITHQLRAERIQRIAVVSDDIEKYGDDPGFAVGTSVHHRRDLDAVQKELRTVPGVSALIYDQVCAAEKRRRRKRGKFTDPDRRVVINAWACEGCGDCSKQANCVSIEPLETPFGRKRRIEQASCNKDYSCAEGLCPSFVSLSGVRPARRKATLGTSDLSALPAPPAATRGSQAILVTGVGGTGVVTIGALLAMAAHMDGLEAHVYDMTGLAQKGGAVYGHIKIGPIGQGPVPSRIGALEATLILGCDLIVSASTEALRAVHRGSTRVALNSHLLPTAHFQLNPNFDFQEDAHRHAIEAAAGAEAVRALDATQASRVLLGDTIGANTLMMGFALQMGWLPVSLAALENAIRLNGAAVDLNLKALALGRLAAADPDRFAALLAQDQKPTQVVPADAAMRAAFLTDYQNADYARRYQTWVARVRAAEAAVDVGSEALTRAFESAYFRLLAVKDEYEVARLLTLPAFETQLAADFDGTPRRTYHLAPPVFARKDPNTGRPRKMEFGPWLTPILRGLAAVRRCRGRWFDPFRWTHDRHLDRALLAEYEVVMSEVIGRLTVENLPLATELATLPDQVKGYGVVREKAAEAMRATQAQLLNRWRDRP
jgi:indolepyruvate ferredoxin oxidoreductase